jgi:hypothetical protein
MNLEHFIPSAVVFLEGGGDLEEAKLLGSCELSSIDVVDYWMDGSRQLDGLAVELRCPRNAYEVLTNLQSSQYMTIEKAIKAVLPTGTYLKNIEAKALLVDPSGREAPEASQSEILDEPTSEGVRLWPGYHYRLFISHHSSHKEVASEIQRVLKKYFVQAFVAHEDIEPTAEWQGEIEYSLRTCHSLCALLTPSFHGSLWTDQEIGFVMGRQLLIIPVWLGADPYGFLGKIQGIQGKSKDGEKLGEEILDTLLANPQSSKVMFRVLASALVGSDSFRATNAIISKLERIPGKDETVFSRIREALESNSNVFDTYTGGGKLKALLARYDG